MIPLHKFIKLPRHMRLRKAAKLFDEAERLLIVSGEIPETKTFYLGKIIELLIQDGEFSPAETEKLKAAHKVLIESSHQDLRYTLNSIYYLLLAETGRYPSDWDFIEPSGSLDPSKRCSFPGMQVYLEDIRSPFNVGAIFRTAESFGVEKIWLSPLCADPRHKRAERTAMGCVDIVPWERLSYHPFSGKTELQQFPAAPVFALETGGIPISDFTFPKKGIIIAGSEELGVSPEALAASDASLGRVSIPTHGAKASLNVSVAFGIVMQAWAEVMEEKDA